MEIGAWGHLHIKNTIMTNLRSTTFASFAALAVFFGASLMTDTDFLAEKDSPFLKEVKSNIKCFHDYFPIDLLSISTDRPLYAPGDKLQVSIAVRDGRTLLPSTKSAIAYVELVGPNGGVIETRRQLVSDGMAHCEFGLGEAVAGGLYKIRTYTHWKKNEGKDFMVEKTLVVQKVVLPRLKFDLEFERKSYSSGEIVGGYVQMTDNSNRSLSSHYVKYVLLNKGFVEQTYSAKSDGEGLVNLKITVPPKAKPGDLILNVETQYEGQTESVSRAIPIAGEEVILKFYPEGGELVSGLVSQVGFLAMDKNGEPVEVSGDIIDSKGERVAAFNSVKNGMGKMIFTPKSGENYHAIIQSPKTLDPRVELPSVLPRGEVLSVEAKDEYLQLKVLTQQTKSVSVIVQIRGEVYFNSILNLKQGENLFQVNTSKMPAGVAQITLFDDKNLPRAERLSFVNLHQRYQLTIKPNKAAYQPGEKVRVALEVRDEQGMPAPAHLFLSVVNDQLLSLANDKSGNLVSAMLLENELNRKVIDPTYYFSGTPQADEAMDLLLMTAGWRRFTWEQILEKQLPTLTFKEEPAIISGTVYKGSDGTVLVGATVQIGGQQAVTDKNGFYQLKGVDLYTPKTMVVKSTGLMNQTFIVNDYNSQLDCYLYDRNYRKRFENIPMAARMNMEVMEDREVPVMMNNAGVVEAKAFNRAKVPAALVVKREFAEVQGVADSTSMELKTRSDATVFWMPDIKIGYSGKADVEFTTNELISSFRITAQGFAGGCHPVTGTAVYATQLPFSIESRLPVEVVCGDQIQLPIVLKNRTNRPIGGVLKLHFPEGIENITVQDSVQTLQPNSAKTIWFKLRVNKAGIGSVDACFAACGQSDAFSIPVKITPAGFPVALSFSGKELRKSFSFEMTHVVAGSPKIKATVYPNFVSDMMSSIEGILQEPYGCFEQTSCTAYPNAMVLSYLREMNSSNSKLMARATDLLDRGYKRLTTFETPAKGYEWFGSVPAHEGLTAYGLMEFADMKRAGQVIDEQMFNRTLNWLLTHRDGKGGFQRESRALHDFGRIDAEIMNAYIVYALTEAGCTSIEREYDHSKQVAIERNDPYLLAMMAQAAMEMGKNKDSDGLLNQLLLLVSPDGSFTGKQHSITYSTGTSLTIETTALAALAMMKSTGEHTQALNRCLHYLVTSRNAYGMFGSTQGTILALKALSGAAKYAKASDQSGEVDIFIDGKMVASKAVMTNAAAPITIDGLEVFLKDQEHHSIELRYKGMKEALPFTLSAEWRTDLPQTNPACAVNLTTQILNKTVKQGETVRMKVNLRNKLSRDVPSTMLCIGIPGGLSLQSWQLKAYSEQSKFSYYEIKGGMLYLYYRGLPAFANEEIAFDLKAEIPGMYTSPASSAYLYYTNEFKSWVPATQVEIVR
jgi:hypothetical protein